jgi:hypothetical protein
VRIPNRITVPETIQGVMKLLTARGWEKAAIVYAFTKPGAGGDRRSAEFSNAGKPAFEKGTDEWLESSQRTGIWADCIRPAVRRSHLHAVHALTAKR